MMAPWVVRGESLDRASGGLLRRALAAEDGELKHGRAIDLLLPAGLTLDRLVLLPLGKRDGVSRLELEQAGGSLAHKLRSLRVREAALASPEGLDLGYPAAEVAAALALGAQLRAYRFTKYHSTEGEEDDPALERLWVMVEGSEQALAGSRTLADAVCRARDLVSEPGNVLTPKAFADACAGLGDAGLEVEILDREALQALGMNALLGVAQGSALPPYVAIMQWHGGGSEPPLALVGKGICFDTGGISIKPAPGHGGHEVGHGRRRRRLRRHARARRPQGGRQRGGRRRSGREHALGHGPAPGRRGPQHGRARPSRSSTPTPRAGCCWPTCCTTRASASSPRRSSISRP